MNIERCVKERRAGLSFQGYLMHFSIYYHDSCPNFLKGFFGDVKLPNTRVETLTNIFGETQCTNTDMYEWVFTFDGKIDKVDEDFFSYFYLKSQKNIIKCYLNEKTDFAIYNFKHHFRRDPFFGIMGNYKKKYLDLIVSYYFTRKYLEIKKSED